MGGGHGKWEEKKIRGFLGLCSMDLQDFFCFCYLLLQIFPKKYVEI